MKGRYYHVYIITNKWNTTLYAGITNNLSNRLWQHKQKLVRGFTSKYNLNKLVHHEVFTNIEEAIAREKQIKGGSRKKKIELIEKDNPKWKDLSDNL